MATAHKCDRCEVLYPYAKGNVSFESYLVETDEEGTSMGYQADLCPACSKEFLAFVKHEYEEDERPAE